VSERERERGERERENACAKKKDISAEVSENGIANAREYARGREKERELTRSKK